MGGFTALNFSPPASIVCFILCQIIYIPGTKNWPSCPWAYCTIAPPAVVAFVIVRVWRPCTVSPWLAIWIAPAGITANKINSITSPFHLLNLKASDDGCLSGLCPSTQSFTKNILEKNSISIFRYRKHYCLAQSRAPIHFTGVDSNTQVTVQVCQKVHSIPAGSSIT